jgi:hypothetical protein
VENFGTIDGGKTSEDTGVTLVDGGSVTNGSASDTKASIYGFGAGVLTVISTTVTNFGTIAGGAGRIGVLMGGGGALTNGSSTDTSALIDEGVVSSPPGSMTAAAVTNFGSIVGGVLLSGGGKLVNGAISDTSATVIGSVQVATEGAPGAVTNFGTIEGAVTLGTAGSILTVESGSTILGGVSGGHGTLDLASGAGAIASIVGGDISAAGASGPYDEFETLEVAAGAAFTLSGAGTVTSGGVATLDVAGTLAVTGSLTVSGTVDGAGILALGGGETDFDSGVRLTVAKVTVSGAATVVDVDTPLAFRGLWTQAGGTVAGSGTLDLTGAGDALENLTLSAAKVEIDTTSATLAGAIDLTSLLTVISPNLTVASATELTGGGTFQLSNSSANTVIGASAATLLQTSVRIEGAGNLGGGQIELTNEAGGAIDGNAATALTIDTGSGAFVNGGLVEAVGAGGLAIDGAVDNTGTLEAAGGTLTVDGAVTGAGSVRISGSTADFAAAFSQNAAFTTAGGMLELADSQGYTGMISGFSKTGASSLDLEDISFASATESYSGTAASGVLTVTDGTHTAKINLTGNYLASVWTLSSDAGGGTVVTDPAAPSAHGLAAAMASFAPTEGGAQSSAPLATPLPQVLAAAPAFHV